MNRETFIQKVIDIEDTLYRVAKTILTHNQDCEDAVQEAILKAYDKLSTLKQEQFFKTWLVRIVLNECYSLKRKEIIKVPYEECHKNINNEEAYDYNELYKAINKLPDKVKITIVLYYVEGYSIEEIKQILKIPSGTVKSRLSKGRKLLKLKLENMEGIYE
ncbi:MAG: RNA polymerase sigma factor [Peptostreptococcaceae bacterium]